jgi:Mlc titration factor MtfA (ptsG expression regulator)
MPLPWFGRRPAPQIDDKLWRRTVADFPFAGHLGEAELGRLRALCEDFLRSKTFSGAHDLAVTPRMRVAIAFQACLPVLHLGLRGYDDFVELVVYPDQFIVRRSQVDEAGVVHESVEALAGEAMDRGPVVLSWADAAPGERGRGWNVTIHEFVHKLDLADGDADGIPPLPRAARARWEQALTDAYDDFCLQLDRVERAIPAHVDPEGPAADPYYARLPLDPYAATDTAEFFAVSGEAFFVAPDALAQAFPAWYEALAGFFRQDPRRRPAGDENASGHGSPP